MLPRASFAALFPVSASSWVGVMFLGCAPAPDIVFIPLTVEFAESSSSAEETEEESVIVLRLSSPAADAVSFTVRASDVSASGHDGCGTRDYSLVLGDAEFLPGSTEARVHLRHLNDELSEVDEQVNLHLESAAGARVGGRSRHEHTIVDDDRSALLDVRADFGARADGVSDDSEAVRQAIERAALSPGAVVLFPPGTYVLESIALIPQANYFGYGAVITRAANRPSDQKGFTLRYSADEDSSPVLVQGFVFDGNRDQQAGTYTNWEYRNADLLDVSGDATRAGRLRLIAEDNVFRNSGASGLLLGPNTDGTLCSLSADEVFTDFVHLRGGYSRLRGQDLLAEGSTGTTGISLRSFDLGYLDSEQIQAELVDVTLASGDLQVTLSEGSSFRGQRVFVEQAPFLLRAPHAQMVFEDSLFTTGPTWFDNNRVVAPSDVTFERTTFLLTEQQELTRTLDEQDRQLVALNVVWNDTELAYDETVENTVEEVIDGQRLRLIDCTFQRGGDVEDSDTSYAIGTELLFPADTTAPEEGSDNRVELSNSNVGDGFNGLFAPQCSGCTQ